MTEGRPVSSTKGKRKMRKKANYRNEKHERNKVKAEV